ncbi:hypothetical protein HPB48_027036 [Haemaphysalis longicornis]|uniref:Uncharacterized protein n=1 Tax=Haemaphysalis longicornis TaxID=44386 RepID=A0A9J6HDN4_HAELO|nr:hypothetical protein HPB48_027036 [Haemaphysalis longicornis]
MVRDQQDVIAKLTKQLEEILNTGHRKPTKTSGVLEKVLRRASYTISRDTDDVDTITRSLVNNRNPTILQARRLGNSRSVIIALEGGIVPYYVYYRGNEYK